MRSFLIAQREKRSSFACSFLFQLTSLPTTVKLSYLFSTEALSCKLQGAGNHMFKNSLPFFFFRASSKTKEWLKKLMKPFANQNWKPVDLKKNSTRNIKWDIFSKVIPFFPIVWQHFSLPLPIKLSQSQSTVDSRQSCHVRTWTSVNDIREFLRKYYKYHPASSCISFNRYLIW